ncbi:ring finger protein [Drepanopeziza brunnea f. sp. 'multigermtubi' MB_m1]|uniref:RBR-type E3 ubiquitin transferase n=1 Tax=Marssonina brunnea f. sp. multigermtubi (strain MB_m1) TaxID=1072389 RepID=K1W5Q2_MARBU|nr:ring finger protein [Drepanopeziza brunnea f. sp. 'multigermtubi' MB_m1]EKD12230.1 ring finger protein [Drepanopeziza brunnea f. sp. 'multigermtubi' MB_m1]
MAPIRNRKKYLSFPEKIFGLKCSQHRASKMRSIFRYYSEPPYGRVDKDCMLKYLVKLQNRLSAAEIGVIESYFGHKGSGKLACGQLDIARGLCPGVECCVCMELFHSDHLPAVTSVCTHEPKVCPDCIAQSIDAQIPQVAWDQIQCPVCPEPLPFDEVKKWASTEAFEQYDKKSLMSVFRNFPSLIMCLGPGCDSGQIHDGEHDQPIMTCNNCQFKTCYTHKMPWHSGQTCAGYEYEREKRMAQEAASDRVIAETTKVCGNPECGARIEKNGGCDHMTCKVCLYQFCYLCLAPYKRIMAEGNTAHAENCVYHSSNLPDNGLPDVIDDDDFMDDSDPDDEVLEWDHYYPTPGL